MTFGAGNSTATVTVDPSADATTEPDETVILTVVAGAGYNVGAPSSATGTITNDDNAVVVSVAVSPGAVNEDGATNLVYTFTRNDSNGALTANFTIGGTATFNTDYTQAGAATFAPPNGTVTFADGSLTATVTVDPTADITVEPDETVILTVVAGAGYSVGAPSSATGTITNDDTDVSVAVAPASVPEDGATNLVYTFTRNGVTTGALTVNFTVGGTATFNTDYTQTGAATFAPPNGTVTFGAGNSTATVTVDPSADATTEPDETVILTVAAGAGYNVGAPSSATGTITNDDNVGVVVSVAVSPGAVNEDGLTNLVYTFTRNDSNGALTANFTIGGTATFNTDYTQTGAATFAPPNGTVTFADGSLTTTVTVDPAADSTVEPDETVILTVAAGAGYGIGAPSSATGTITNDDTDVSVAVAPASVVENGATNLVYTFTRNGVTSGPLTVNFTIGGTATFNTDYTQTGAATFAPPNGTVTFGAGSSTATITVDPSGDTIFETDETVILTVVAGAGYGIGAPSSATGTITNDDIPFAGVRLVISTIFRCEGGNIVAAVAISNQGDTTAFSVQLTQAALSSPAQNGTPLPQSYGDIGPGQSIAHDVGFGSYPAGQQVFKLKGTYAGTLQFSSTQLVQIPGCVVSQSTVNTSNGALASSGSLLDLLGSQKDDDPLSFLPKVGTDVPTSQQWLEAFDWKLIQPGLLFYWLTTDMNFQRSPQQSSHLQVFHVVPKVSRISNNGK